MSKNANHSLKDGRIITASSESMCGVHLNVGSLYVISGKDNRISLCNNYVKEYSKMTIVERRGFAGGYKKGCLCEVSAWIIFFLFLWRKLIFFFSIKRSKWLVGHHTNINDWVHAIGNYFRNVKLIMELVFRQGERWHRKVNPSSVIGDRVHCIRTV